MGEAQFNWGTQEQQRIVRRLFDREVERPSDGQRANPDVIKAHVTLLTKKLIIIILLFIVAIIGLLSLIIGIIAFQRQCYLPRLPSIPMWLMTLGGMSIILVSALIYLIIVATVIKYKSNEKLFRRGFMLTTCLGAGVLGWAVGPGSSAMFFLPISSQQCLGFVLDYCVVIYFILCICSCIHGLYCGYKAWQYCCTRHRHRNAVMIVPVNSNCTQIATESSTVANTNETQPVPPAVILNVVDEKTSQFPKLPSIKNPPKNIFSEAKTKEEIFKETTWKDEGKT